MGTRVRSGEAHSEPQLPTPILVIHVFIGTKAEYIKVAPLLLELERRGTKYRLIDSGQHGDFTRKIRGRLGVREPDLLLGGPGDKATVGGAVVWALKLLTPNLLLGRRRLRERVFGLIAEDGRDGASSVTNQTSSTPSTSTPSTVSPIRREICLVHGDTPTAFIAMMLAKRAGLIVAHIESGLRSHSYLAPLPEELIRVAVMKRADILFAPSDEAVRNLEEMRVRGQIVPTGGNTSLEALSNALGDKQVTSDGVVVMTTHRVENLKKRSISESFVELIERVSEKWETVFVMHPPTRAALKSHGLYDRVMNSDADVLDMVDHEDFVALISSAPFVVTDGGSIQEECALLGVPTLLWRGGTERPDGLGVNVVLSLFDSKVIDDFLSGYEGLRIEPVSLESLPSRVIVERIEGWK